MRTHTFLGAFAIMSTVALAAPPLAAQNPTPAPPPTQPPASPATQLTAPQTLVGCLYREKDVPGRAPNIVEKAGVLEDYILADATIGTTGKAPATGKMYKVEKIADDQLKKHVGKKVEVMGRIDAEPGDVKTTPGGAAPKPDKTPGPDDIELPELEAVSIKEVAGTCPAKPMIM